MCSSCSMFNVLFCPLSPFGVHRFEMCFQHFCIVFMCVFFFLFSSIFACRQPASFFFSTFFVHYHRVKRRQLLQFHFHISLYCHFVVISLCSKAIYSCSAKINCKMAAFLCFFCHPMFCHDIHNIHCSVPNVALLPFI